MKQKKPFKKGTFKQGLIIFAITVGVMAAVIAIGSYLKAW